MMYMGVKVPDAIKIAAREMRNNPTLAEKKLWNYIRRDISGFRFLRQKPLYLYSEDSGLDRFIIPYFYCHEKKLIIEVDGSVHDIQEVMLLDGEKEKLLQNQEIEVMRIENIDIINNIEIVMQRIKIRLS